MQASEFTLPRQGDEPDMGKYGPVKPRTAAYGWNIIARVKPGGADKIRAMQAERVRTIGAKLPEILAPLQIHFLKWSFFDNDTRFQYTAIFDTDFDRYTDDALKIFQGLGQEAFFVHLEGFPEDGMTNPAAFGKFVHDHHVDCFFEYSEYPGATVDEIKKGLKVRRCLSEMLDQMQ